METENTPDNNLKLKSAASELMIENVVLSVSAHAA